MVSSELAELSVRGAVDQIKNEYALLLRIREGRLEEGDYREVKTASGNRLEAPTETDVLGSLAMQAEALHIYAQVLFVEATKKVSAPVTLQEAMQASGSMNSAISYKDDDWLVVDGRCASDGDFWTIRSGRIRNNHYGSLDALIEAEVSSRWKEWQPKVDF